MGILGFLLLGLIAGAIAKTLMPGNDRGGILVTMLLGVVGAVLGGWLGSLDPGHRRHGRVLRRLHVASAIVGSFIVLGIYRPCGTRHKPPPHVGAIDHLFCRGPGTVRGPRASRVPRAAPQPPLAPGPGRHN